MSARFTWRRNKRKVSWQCETHELNWKGVVIAKVQSTQGVWFWYSLHPAVRENTASRPADLESVKAEALQRMKSKLDALKEIAT